MRKEVKFLIAMLAVIVGGSLTLIYGQAKTPPTGANEVVGKRPDFPPPPPPDGFRGGPHRGPDMFAELNLTDQQREQIDAIRSGSREASREAETKIRQADEQLRLMVDSGTFDAEKAAPLIRAKADAFASLDLNRLAADAEIHKLLTQDQKTRLTQLRDRRPPPPPGGGFGPAGR